MKVDFTNVPKHYAIKTREQMLEVLMDPQADSPSIFYHMIRGNAQQKNVTVLETGTVGGEYIKTVGHYHIGELNETYYIKNGQGVALLQKLATDASGNFIADVVEEFKAVPFKEGDKVFMPGDGWGHVLVNTGEAYLITVDDTIVDFIGSPVNPNLPHAEYELVKKMQGFAFYVVEQSGNPVLVRNQKYKDVLSVYNNDLKLV